MQKRLALIQSHMPVSGLRILDCGCGAGAYVMALLELGADTQGIEYSRDKVADFLSKGREVHRVRQGDLESLPFPNNTFDMALLNEVLEHVPDDNRALEEIFRVLKPDGHLVIFSPNRWYPFETHGTTLNCFKLNINLPPCMPFIPYVPIALGNRIFKYHARNYFQSELIHLLSRVGFQVTYRTWIWQTFENISGRQPFWMRWMRPMLRKMAFLLENTPFFKRFGVSQVLFAVKPALNGQNIV